MEALERRKCFAAVIVILIVFFSNLKGVESRNSTKMSYVCPPQFIRLGHSCYYFSETKATWQNALFACKDRDSNLTVPARWEDRNLRNYLNEANMVKTSRWIGGIYDYAAKAWKWGGELKQMRYQSFSRMKKLSPEELQWHCISMVPELLYRWAPRSCIEPRPYICQTKLRKVPKSKVKALRKRWQSMGRINEINAPGVSGEHYSRNLLKNFTRNGNNMNPSALRLRPGYNKYSTTKQNARSNDVTKKRPSAQSKMTRPFPGYSWNRKDPEGSYRFNADLLLKGSTGLSPQQVKVNLARIKHLRDKQIANKRNKNRTNRNNIILNDIPQQTRRIIVPHAKTYTLDSNISALYPKMIIEDFDTLLPQAPPSIAYKIRTRSIG